MNFFMLSYFAAVCRVKSISKAAEGLSLSRQALSKSLMVLEGELGVKLLVRKRSGVELTPAGEVLYRRCTSLLSDWDQTLEELEEVKRAYQEPLRVGYGQMSYNLWELDHVDLFRKAHPNIALSYEIALPDSLYQGLLDQRFDLIVASARYDSERLSSTLILKRPLYAVFRQDDPLAEREVLHLSDLAGRSIILGAGHSNFSSRLQEVFRTEGVPAGFLPCPSPEPFTIFRSVREGRGFYFTAALQSFYNVAMDGLVYRPFSYEGLNGFPTRDIYATTLRENADSFAVGVYLRYLLSGKHRSPEPAAMR